nr:hypothetical protein GCM10020063_069530 [Dactylosporangium thailandense]
MSGNSTHAAQPAPAQAAPGPRTTAEFPDRLAELRGVSRGIRPAQPPAPAAPAPAAAPVTESARATGARASRSTRASRPPKTAPATRSRATRPPASKPAPRPKTRRTAAAPNGAGYSGGVVGFAMAQVGKDYAFGSTGPDAFDCSGLVVAAYRNLGIALPRSTGGLAGVGRPVSRGDLQPGDLVFPSSGHVGIYIGGGRMVHASTERGGVKVSSVYAFRFARRVMN